MKTYEEMVAEYRRRQHDTVVDAIATGLTYMDEMAVEAGLLEEAGANMPPVLRRTGGSPSQALLLLFIH